jgi:hypothetical protein
MKDWFHVFLYTFKSLITKLLISDVILNKIKFDGIDWLFIYVERKRSVSPSVKSITRGHL